MKTTRYITATLIAMVLTFTTIQAQSARHPASKEREETRKQTTHTQHSARQVQTQRSTQPAQRVQAQRSTQPAQRVQAQRSTQPAQRVQAQRSTQPAQRVQAPQVRPQRTVQQVRKTESQQDYRSRTTSKVDRPVNITTSHNPKNSYRKPESKVYDSHNRNRPYKENKYSTQRYYTGHHYHNAYPTQKVNFHYHHDTYAHNYHVLYYPSHTHIYWTRSMYHNYRRWYPDYSWNYRYGHRINTISVFDAKYNLGEVANVYGRVYATWYNAETNDYLLFFGGDYPYQQFTVVLPARIARKYSWRPERYFLGEHITVTGLITTFDGSPEIVVRDKYQLGIY